MFRSYFEMARVLLFLLAIGISEVCGSLCTFSHGNYHVTYGVRAGTVHFRLTMTGIQSRSTGWTGIGFGKGMTQGIDVILVRLMNGRVIITDEYVRGYTNPFPDRINNVQVQSTGLANGVLTAAFSRTAHSTESPYDASIQGCQTWQFIAGLNRMNPKGDLYHHIHTPMGRTVCIDQCRV